MRTKKPRLKPIVALAIDCDGTTYASDGVDTFDDRSKLLATTSNTSCDPSVLCEIDLNVPGKQTW